MCCTKLLPPCQEDLDFTSEQCEIVGLNFSSIPILQTQVQDSNSQVKLQTLHAYSKLSSRKQANLKHKLPRDVPILPLNVWIIRPYIELKQLNSTLFHQSH